MTPIKARPRKPCRESVGMKSRSVLASSTPQDRSLTTLDDVRRAFDRRRRLSWHDLADHQIIKEHLDGGQVLLDRLRRAGLFLYKGRNKHGSNRPDVIDVIF